MPLTAASLDATGLFDVLVAFRAGLARHEETINRLNVYPVPDGDTGTNMLRTVESAEQHAERDGVDAESMLAAIGRGALMGARGNSGVILSQILRALTGAADPVQPFGAVELASALQGASDAARAAVLRPVEGTLLTVANDAATAAVAAAEGGGDLAAAVLAARDGVCSGLDRTPSLLKVLADAGVVDAGGAGLTQLFEALVTVVTGSPMPTELSLPDSVAALIASGGGPSVTPRAEASEPSGVAELRYEVMFLLEARDDEIDGFKARWSELGDSIVVVGGDGIFNCHIHTDDIGGSIEAAIAVGRPHEIRVTDLLEQSGAESVHGAVHNTGSSAKVQRVPAATGVVAVASGRGVAEILRSLGVEEIVVGGQSMNPSTEELLAGIGASVSQEVIVLPNNSNIVAVAQQAAALAGRAVIVVPTRSVQEGLAALIAYDPAASAESNASAMTTAAGAVVSGEVTRAARDASTPVGPVRAGAWIGVGHDGVLASGPSCAATAAELVEALITDHHELLTVIEGADAPPGEVTAFIDTIAERHPSLCVERHDGGQPLYPILISLE